MASLKCAGGEGVTHGRGGGLGGEVGRPTGREGRGKGVGVATLMPLLIGAHKQWPQRVDEAVQGAGSRAEDEEEARGLHCTHRGGRGMCVCVVI